MNTHSQTDGLPSVYVSGPAGANRMLPLSYRAPVDSTNSACLRALAEPDSDDWMLLWTDDQTAGRGRQGRVWQSRPGDSLCLSVARRLPSGSLIRPSLTVALGAALASALNRRGFPVGLKWPNDLLLSGRKLGGILCEASSNGPAGTVLLVAGVGLNLRPVAVPEGDAGLPPASLAEAAAVPEAPELAVFLAQVLADLLSSATDEAVLSGWCSQAARFDVWREKSVCLVEQGQTLASGKAAGIQPDGRYCIQTASGDQLVSIGDLSLRETGR